MDSGPPALAEAKIIAFGVQEAYRRQGIGKKLMTELIDCAAQQGIPQLSLSVSKDNHAIHLYRQQGFQEYADNGDSFIMSRPIKIAGPDRTPA